MSVLIDKFWIEGVLAGAYPDFLDKGGVDLDNNGEIAGDEAFGDLNKDGVLGDRGDYEEYLRKNRSSLAANVPFFKWGERLGVENRMHQMFYLLSDIHSATNLASAYVFIADLKEWVDLAIGEKRLSPSEESQVYYAAMRVVGNLFDAQEDSSLVANIRDRQLDCDSSSYVAMAIGDERGLTLQGVRSPHHFFLRGMEEDREFNIDFGKLTSDTDYLVDPILVEKGAYLATLDHQTLEADFLGNRGIVLEKLGRYEEALASYDRALEIDPQNATAHYNRGVVLGRLGRYEEALKAFRRARELGLR